MSKKTRYALVLLLAAAAAAVPLIADTVWVSSYRADGDLNMALAECDFQCYVQRQGDRCSRIETVSHPDGSVTTGYVCCHERCGTGCPPGYDTNCQSDQQPDQCGCCYNYSPIVIDIAGNGVEFSSAESGVFFDINGRGIFKRVAWPLSADDAWLALDGNGNGSIDDGSELFGNTTRLASGELAEQGYAALAELDANQDGTVDARDPAFVRLRLWRDLNRDGISEAGELFGLSGQGIVALSTDYRESGRRDRWGNRFRYRAKVTASQPPHSRFSYDVFPVMEVRPTN